MDRENRSVRSSREEQIARMKRQTFGVEVECNRITREKAARTAAEWLGTARAEDTSARNGYLCWSAWDRQGREWRFQKDGSIQGPEEEKCEVISPVLRYEDMDMLQGLIRRLRKAGARSDPSRGCGVHVHVGIRCETGDHDAGSLRNLINMMASHEEQIGRAILLDRNRRENYCRAVEPELVRRVNEIRPGTMKELEDLWYSVNPNAGSREARYHTSRYHMLNLHAVFTRGTIEFRMFQFDEPRGARKGGLHAGALKAYIQLSLAMSEQAKTLKTVRAHPPQTENEKYAFRCWLLRLGFIGEEFRTARTILLRNLEGDAAWRTPFTDPVHGRSCAGSERSASG